jgi:short-subunit dehydrogenase
MIARKKGGILNIGSVASYFPGPGMAVYYATKAYVLSFSEALAEELAPHNITVRTLCPGPTETGFQNTANMDMKTVMGGLFANMPSAAEVAAYGYNSFLRSGRVHIHGWMNHLMIGSTKMLPTSWKAAIMGKIQMQRMGR